MYNELLGIAEEHDVYVVEKKFKSSAKGLCKGNRIGINKNVETEAEKTCILAEELGHFFTTYGDIIDQNTVADIKQENRAREWAFSRLISFEHLFKAFKQGIRNQYELADFLGVTEAFLQEALEHYKSKYGACYQCEQYIIYFEPFGILKLL